MRVSRGEAQRCLQTRKSRGQARVVAVLQGPKATPPKQTPFPPVRNPGLSIRTAAQLTAEDVKTLTQGVSFPSRTAQEHSLARSLPSEAEERNRLQDADAVWVFSYGGGMCYETLAKRDISVYARDPAFVVDPSVRLVFKHRGGHATLLSLPEGTAPRFRPPGTSKGQPCVHGVLYRIKASDVKLMESREQGYVMTQMEVETYDGLRIKANVWVSGALSLLPQEVTPPEIYMRKLREGAAFNFIDPNYQAWLSSIETVTSAGLPLDQYYNTPGRYISYSLMMVSLFIVGGWLSQHM